MRSSSVVASSSRRNEPLARRSSIASRRSDSDALSSIARATLDTFLEKLAVPHTYVEQRERPDFLLVSSKRIGIEIVDTTVASLATHESTTPRFEDAMAAALRDRGVFADVTIHTRENSSGPASLSSNEQRIVTARLVDLAAELADEGKHDPRGSAHAELHSSLGPPPLFPPIMPRTLIPTIRWVHVQLRDDETSQVMFCASASRWGGIASRLREVVAAKEAKLKEYRKSCPADAYWLVFSTDTRFSSEVREWDAERVEVESSFDAVAIACARSRTSPGWARWWKAPSHAAR